jgi:hypothetical protein
MWKVGRWQFAAVIGITFEYTLDKHPPPFCGI